MRKYLLISPFIFLTFFCSQSTCSERLLIQEQESICRKIAQEIDVEQLEGLCTPTGLTFQIWFVDNTNPSSGDGSFANPFNTLLGAQMASNVGDVIYVFAGDGTSTGMDMGFIMKDNQKLFGSGTSFHLKTCCGFAKVLPKTANAPLITNTAGNGIELANNNEVKGIHIDGTSGWGIYGNAIQEANIVKNKITNPASSGGIGIFDSTGTLDIKHNVIQGISSAAQNGIDLENHGSLTMYTEIRDNDISNFSEGIIVFSFDNCVINSFILDNSVSNTSYSGIDADAFVSSRHNMTISNNTLFSNAGQGIISFSSFGSVVEARISSNLAINNAQEGIAIATGNGGTLYGIATHNFAVGNGGLGGILAETSSTPNPGDRLCLRLKDNQSDTGFYLQNFPADTFNLEPLTGNIGTVTTVGTITNVPDYFCE